MKKIFALLMLLCITLGADAQLLWKISGNGLDKPSYIFGTHHVAPLSMKDSIAGMPEAMEGTSQVYGELVMEDMMKPEMLMKMQQAMMLPGDTTLKSLFTPAQYDSIASVVKENIGMEIAMFDKVKPAALNAQLAVVLSVKAVKGYNPQEQLDTWFQTQARQAGKKVGGLESTESQINVLYNSQSLKRQAQQLYCSATHIGYGIDMTRRLAEAYLDQNLDKLLEITEEKMGNACDSTPEEEEALIYGRNADWAKRMPGIMKQAPTLFVVGAVDLLLMLFAFYAFPPNISITSANEFNKILHNTTNITINLENDIDLKNIDEGDFTAWILSFNSANTTGDTTTYDYTYEIRLGIAKTAEGYKIAELNGINWSEEDYNNITASDKIVQDEDGILNVSFVVSYADNTLNYTFQVNDASIENTASETGAIVGFRSLWNAVTNTDDVVLLNLQKAYKNLKKT